MASLQKKLMISLISSNLFLIINLINLPATYKFMNKVGLSFYNTHTGCPTHIGLIHNALIFFIITYITMGNYASKAEKIKHSLYGTLIYYFVSSPALYYLMGQLVGNKIADLNGCPTNLGITLHSFIYFLILVAVMYLP